MVLFTRGEGMPDLLLLSAHHLIVDAVSWQILIEDISTIYIQLTNNQKISLPMKTTSFKLWSERLWQFGQSSTIVDQSRYWLGICDRPNSFPVDYPEGENNYASMDVITVSLDADKTHSLLHEVSGTYNTRINDVLLSSLLLASADVTNLDGIRLDLESHGRESFPRSHRCIPHRRLVHLDLPTLATVTA